MEIYPFDWFTDLVYTKQLFTPEEEKSTNIHIPALFHTFFLTTMTFSAGMYKNGNKNRQLKLPVPSRDLTKTIQEHMNK